jgi:hypothetical protein
MKIKRQLIDLLDYTYTQEQDFAAGLSESERATVDALERWSAKDNLAHCAAWQKILAGNLAAAAAGGPYERAEEIDRKNDEFFTLHQADSWEVIMLDLKLAYQALAGQTRRLSEKELASEEVLPWQQGRPLWRLIVGNGALHPLSHLATCYSLNGQGKKGLAIFEAALPGLAALSSEAPWQGMLVYDLACFSALAGEKSRAIESLKKAFQLAPEFTEWSKQDSDLDSLRAETEFRALYKD